MNHKYYAVVAAAILSGCASSTEMTNVIPREGGIYEVVSTGEDKQEALSSALSASQTECKQRGMRFVVVDRKEEYKGVLGTEGNSKAVDTVSGIVTATTGNYVPSLSRDDDYRVTMLFKCEPESQPSQARSTVQ